MNKIDITMTATMRHKVVEETLISFFKKMLMDQSRFRLIINVDPIGNDSKKKWVEKVANRFFKDVLINIPSEPGFTKAVQWCWSQTKSEYVFHLEDDWKLLRPVNIDSMIEILEKNQDLVSLRLSKINIGSTKFGNKNGFIEHPKISLNPTLFKGDFLRTVSPLMDLSVNPEKQLRINKTPRGKYISKFIHGIYVKDSNEKIVEDIGREWMNESKYTKKIGFMKWELKK